MRLRSRSRASRRGSIIVLVAASLPFALAVGALAVDMGMLFKVRVDAQRSADAAALAGASAFMDPRVNLAAITAADRALEYAGRNYVGMITTNVANPTSGDSNGIQVTQSGDSGVRVEVTPTTQTVRVVIRHRVEETFVRSLLGLAPYNVSAAATAAALDAGAAQCVMPFALPDIWAESNAIEDANGDEQENADETWSYDPTQGDTYAPFGQSGETGYGSPRSTVDGDLGREIILRPQVPGYRGPGSVKIWGGDDHEGELAERIECDATPVRLGDPVEVIEELPNQLGREIRNRVDSENASPNTPSSWDPSTNRPTGDWRNSRRVVLIPLYHPGQLTTPVGGQITFNNFALFYLERPNPSLTGEDERITGRLLFYASGSQSDDAGVPRLVKTVRLVR